MGTQFSRTVADLETVKKGDASPVKVSVVQTPTVPTAPVSPKPMRNLGLGVVLGLLLGLGVALLRDMLDTRIKGEKDCEQVTDATVIGGIAYDADAVDHPLHRPDRRAHALAPRPSDRCAPTCSSSTSPTTRARSSFTSSLPGEGKTTTPPTSPSPWPPTGARVCVIEARPAPAAAARATWASRARSG